MAGVLQDLLVLGLVASPFVAMPLMWRRMKRVRASAHAHATEDELPPQPAWEEALEREGGITLARAHHPNDDLIGLGDKARHARWPLTNE
jgi:hypothetical protein